MEYRDPFARSYTQPQAVATDAGLRAYMLRIYNYMASALALTGIVALVTVKTPALLSAFYVIQDGRIVGQSGLTWLVFFGLIGIAFYINMGINRITSGTAQALFWAYAALFGLLLSSILLEYTGTSIARTFFVTAGTFGAVSLYGYTTKRDLTSAGHFLQMGVIGIFIALIVNSFMHSPGVDFALSVIGVLVFTGLTAYNTQSLKAIYYQIGSNGEMLAKASILGALSLYADFMNIFLFLLRFMGDRR